MTDLWTMAGEEAERDAAEHHLALARVACASYWPVLAHATNKDEYEHAKALISEGVTAAVAVVAASPADQAILASRVLDSFDEDWEKHRTAVVENAPAYVEQHPFGLPAEPLLNEAPELENEIAAWEGADQQTRVNMGNGLGVSDDSSGPNVEGPGANQGEEPLLHASALDIEAGLPEGDYRLDAFGALIPVQVQKNSTVRHTAPGGGEHAPYYIREEGGKFKVVNRNGEVKGTHGSKAEARAQQKALYANVPGATEEAEKRHGHTPKAVAEEGKKASLQLTARELRCTKCGAEVTPQDTKGNYGSCSEGGKHTPEWGPDKEASLQLTALQRQAVAVARNLVDQMPEGVQPHAVAKAMLMRARGFDLDQGETDLVVNAAIERANERLAIVGYPPGYMEQDHMRANPEIRRMLGRVHVSTPDDEVRDMAAKWAEGKGAKPGEPAHDQAIADALAVHHHNQDEFAWIDKGLHGDVAGSWPRSTPSTPVDPNQGRLFAKRHTADGVSQEKRDRAEKAGDTLPGTDKFPITNASDVEKAKHDIGRTNEPHDKVVNYINRKAEEFGEPKVGEDDDGKKEGSRVARLWRRVIGRQVEAQGMSNPMNPSSVANPFSPAQDVNASMSDSNPTMGDMAAGAGGMMSPSTQPPDEIQGQTIPGSATAASSKPRTKPSNNPNAPKPPPLQQGMGFGPQLLTGTPMMAARARVAVADSILAMNPGMGDDEALHLASRTIERYPHLVSEAYGGSDYPFDFGDQPAYSTCPQCGIQAYDSRSEHCHNCGYVGGAAGAGWDPLSGPTTIRPGQADLRNPGIR